MKEDQNLIHTLPFGVDSRSACGLWNDYSTGAAMPPSILKSPYITDLSRIDWTSGETHTMCHLSLCAESRGPHALSRSLIKAVCHKVLQDNHTSPDCVNMWSASNKSVRYQTAVRTQRGWSGDHCVHISVHTVKWSLCSLRIGTHPVLTLCVHPSYGSLDRRHDSNSVYRLNLFTVIAPISVNIC